MKRAKPIRELYKGMTPEDLRIIEKGKELLLMEVDLISNLRKDPVTQEELAEIMEIRQSAISQIENQEDVLVKTLERYIRALGGELEVRARFPDRVVVLGIGANEAALCPATFSAERDLRLLGQFTRRASAKEARIR